MSFIQTYPRFTLTVCVFLAGLTIFHLLERWAPIYPTARGPRRRGYLADFTASIVNGPLLGGLTKLAATWLVLLLPWTHNVLGAWPWWLQFAVFLLVNDFARYWLHVWYHQHPLLWRIHRVHHTVVEMDALSTFRVHIFEAVIKYGVIILPFRLLGIDPWVIAIYSSIDVLKGFWHHANWRTRIGWLNYIFNSAELHWWHHAIEFSARNYNYGSIFSVWDWLFGTAYYRPGQWPREIGVEGMAAFPDSYLGQLASVAVDDEAGRERWDASRPARLAPEPAERPTECSSAARSV